MSGSYYVLNAKYNSLLALISGGGGGGGVSNPMTSDLNAGGFDITNATDINAVDLNASADLTANRVIATNLVQGGTLNATDILLTPNINRTDAPSYGNLGSIAPGNQYEIATIEPKVDAEGTILGVLRGLDTGLKHTVFFQVVGYADRAVIQILNNVSESDTPIFASLEYGEDSVVPTKNSLTFTCSTPSATCEIAFYQNGGDKGTGLGYGSPFIPASSGVVATHSTTYAQTTLNLNTAGTSANFKVDSNLFADDTDTKNLQTNTLAVYTDAEIGVNSTMNLAGANSIKQVVSVQTNEVVSGGAFPVQISSDADFQNNKLVNSGGDFLNIDENIDLQAVGHGIINLNSLTGTSSGADDIVMNSDVDMNNNAIINVDNIKVNSIFENTAGADVSIHNTLNMTNNHIHNLAAPTQNADAANKLYVDTVAGGSGVQNPMVANLDGGGFNISNTSSMTSTSLNSVDGGGIFSRGTFTHGGSLATIGVFGVGGDEIVFAPNTSFTLRAFGGTPDYFVYDAGTATWEAKNGSTTSYATGSVATFAPGGLLILDKTTSVAATQQEISILDVKPGTNQQEYLQTQGFSNAVPNIPKAITPTFTYNLSVQDVAAQIPFNVGFAWDNTSDGSIIRMYDSNSLAVRFGLPPNSNNNPNNPITTYGYLCGVGINNSSQSGGWVCSGGATIELVYTNQTAIDSPFPTPIIIGQAGNAFNSESITIPQSNWVYCDRLSLSGIELAIRLNIPPGDTIDTQDPVNSSLNCNKFQTATIDLV